MRRLLARHPGWLGVLACAGLLTSCAPGITVRGQILASAATAHGSRLHPGMADAVVWLDSIPAATERRIRRHQSVNTVKFSTLRSSRRVVVDPGAAPMRLENRDRVYHLLFAMTSAGACSLGISRPDSTLVLRPPSGGALSVFCRIHSNEELWIRVVPNQAFARADRLGRFRLPPVPKGSYVVHAWHPDLGETRAPIEVHRGRTPPITLTL